MADYTTYASPIGVAAYARLNRPDVYKENGKPKGEPKYSVSLILDESQPAVQEFTDFLDAQMEEAHQALGCREMGKPPYKPYAVKNRDSGKYETQDGKVEVPFAVIAQMETKNGTWDRKPVFFDVNGRPYEEEPMVGSGSIIRLNFQIWQRPAFGKTGIGLQPTEVQIIKLVEAKPGVTGFGAVEPSEGFGASVASDDEDNSQPAPQARPDF